MARFAENTIPILGISLDDAENATVSTSFSLEWGIARDIERGIEDLRHRIIIEVWGADRGGGIVRGERGEDDLLFTFLSSEFRSPTPTIVTSTNVSRDRLDEDRPRGLRKKRRNRTDRDEIYVRGRLEVFGSIRPGRSPRWERFRERSPRSEIVSARF